MAYEAITYLSGVINKKGEDGLLATQWIHCIAVQKVNSKRSTARQSNQISFIGLVSNRGYYKAKWGDNYVSNLLQKSSDNISLTWQAIQAVAEQ